MPLPPDHNPGILEISIPPQAGPSAEPGDYLNLNPFTEVEKEKIR
jgi:hypothetical protein